MALFNELGKKITQVGQDAVKGTKDLAEITKINSMISDEERSINSFYTQLGAKYYELFSKECDENLKSFCLSISESLEKIEEHHTQIKKIKGIKKCKQCSAEVSATTTFCGACGFNTSEITKEETNEVEEKPEVLTNICANCNKELADGVLFCTECGHKI